MARSPESIREDNRSVTRVFFPKKRTSMGIIQGFQGQMSGEKAPLLIMRRLMRRNVGIKTSDAKAKILWCRLTDVL